jgi:branched-chain amino acid transport system substrate-binding protein
MLTKSSIYRWMVLMVLLGLFVGGCAPAAEPTTASAPETGGEEAEAPSEGEAPAEPAEGADEVKPYKFVVAGPMTGDVAELGGYQLSGVEMAVEEINAAGGINGRPIEIMVFDDKCDSTEAAIVASRVLAEEDVFAVIGHMCSGASMAAGPLYDEAGLTFLTASSTAPALTEQGWTHLFRTITHDAAWGPVLGDIAIQNFDAKKVAIFYATDDYGVGLLETMVPALEGKGVEVVAQETYRAGDKDFSAQLSKVATLEPDVLMLLTEYTEMALITRQRVAAGMTDVGVVCASNGQFQQFIDLAGEAAEGAIIGVAWDKWSTDPAVKSLNDKCIADYGGPCNEVDAYYYDAVYIMKQAIEEGATRETLNEVLRDIHFEGPTGVTEFLANGDIKPKMLFAQTVLNGEFASFDLNK